MRRAASLRSHTRSATTSSANASAAVDELGTLREEAGGEDSLRAAVRENEKLKDQIQALQAMLAQRPPAEKYQALQKEYSNLDLILHGTQRENERCMAELERAKQREKTLEAHLTKLVGENWQNMVAIAPSTTSSIISGPRPSLGSASPSRRATSESPVPPSASVSSEISNDAKMAQLEQIRMLVLGMDQRLQTREDALAKALERAEAQGVRFDALAKEMDVGSA
ncbi:hypothetical protein AURDEDRAFT_145523 [Auricularia subglabra TFB-10046 SS5]|nr:hypothetical protein AURDEDRAFT_145523 [Auricularia subglabra TFB-10046 SS5]